MSALSRGQVLFIFAHKFLWRGMEREDLEGEGMASVEID